MVEYDFYKDLASRVLNKPVEEVTMQERQHVKKSLYKAMYSGVINDSIVTNEIIPNLLSKD